MNEHNNILLWLAASRFSNREINSFFQWLDRNGSGMASDAISLLRDGRPLVSEKKIPEARPRNSYEDLRIDEHASMIEGVEKLLLIEARLTKTEATKILFSELSRSKTEYGYLSAPNKTSFRSWLARVGEDVSDSEVLHVASKIRNEIVHGSRSVSDWPI